MCKRVGKVLWIFLLHDIGNCMVHIYSCTCKACLPNPGTHKGKSPENIASDYYNDNKA